MSEDIADESLPADTTLGLNSLSIDSDTGSNPQHKDEEVNKDKQKVIILLKATGNAPIIKKQRWAVDPEKTVGWIVEFVRKFLKLDANEKLFLYVNQTFAPSPDQLVRNLYECFGTNGKLILHYCKSQAWG